MAHTSDLSPLMAAIEHILSPWLLFAGSLVTDGQTTQFFAKGLRKLFDPCSQPLSFVKRDINWVSPGKRLEWFARMKEKRKRHSFQ